METQDIKVEVDSLSKNIKARAFKASIFVVSGNGISKIIRLLSNLILTRLLVPEFFGIIALARTFDTGISLFSDIGIQPSIIRSKRVNDSTFINTAWTLSVIRGFVLWPFSIIIAFPISRFYEEPLLLYIIPLIGLTFIIRGFRSTSMVMLSKELKQGKLTIIELGVQIINVVITIIFAYLYRNIWALIIGSLVSEIVKTIWSHLLRGHERNYFRFEKAAVMEILTFGKWIFVSTSMMFLASQADKLLLGKFFPLTLLGVYYIAVIFADLPKKIVSNLSNKIIFPILSKASSLPRDEIRLRIQQHRKPALLILSISVAIFASFGDILILTLYDQRYEQASWMLPLLSIGIWPLILTDSIGPVLFALGKPKYLAAGNFAKFLYMIIFVPLLYKLAGVFGAVMAVALNDIPIYIIVNYGLVKEKLSLLKQDLWSTLQFIMIIFILIILRLILGIDFPTIFSFVSI